LSSRLDATTVFGIRRRQKRDPPPPRPSSRKKKRFEAKRIYTHTFPLAEVPTAIRYARDRVDDAIKVIVQNRAV
jgi:threonine dehydrogenase-like Zn-dependent dehydrogenase